MRKFGFEIVKSTDLFTPETPLRPILAGFGGWDTVSGGDFLGQRCNR
jgi:hypothetical protein